MFVLKIQPRNIFEQSDSIHSGKTFRKAGLGEEKNKFKVRAIKVLFTLSLLIADY